MVPNQDLEWIPPANHTPKRILIVDDHITNRQVANLLLSEMKHETVEVDSAQAALALLSMREDFDLVLMDCQMPDMDGYEATRQIRSGAAGEANRSIPIAALTAHALPEDRERCLSAGMNEYLAKPFTMHELAHVIEVLTQGSAPAPSPSTEARLHDQLRVLSDNDSAAYAAILSTYAETLRADFARIGRALESRDSTAIQALAHRLKSSSLQLGASAVGAAMGDVEQQAAGNDLDSIQAGWDALTAKVEQALQWAEREHGTTSTEVAEATPAMPEVAKPPVADEDDADRSCTVLVIDDDPLISRIISRILKAYDVTIQNNSTDAITHCIAHRPALVLCDMMLPDMNGMQIYTHVQEQAPELAERFIFMTGGVFEAEIKTFLDRIDNQVLMKPFDTKTLRALVEKKLGGPKDDQQ